jgi:hypothetical protein
MLTITILRFPPISWVPSLLVVESWVTLAQDLFLPLLLVVPLDFYVSFYVDTSNLQSCIANISG